MRYRLWLYTLRGTRRELYDGRSLKRAIECAAIAKDVIFEFSLNATLLLNESANWAMLEPAEPLKRWDYVHGQLVKEKNNIKLALDI